MVPSYNTEDNLGTEKERSKTYLETAYKNNSPEVQCYINNEPKWDKGLGLFTLNFYDRVKEVSVKNFQLIEQNDKSRRVVVQFGKVDDNTYHLDYQYPFTLFQAFAVALSSCDSKLFA